MKAEIVGITPILQHDKQQVRALSPQKARKNNIVFSLF